MSITLSYDHHESLSRAIITEDGQVADCFFDKLDAPQRTGEILTGAVDRILQGRGAFLRLPDGQQGFLNDADGLQSGTALCVQIKNDSRENKAVALTRNVSLPGVYVVHNPFGNGVHASRRLADAGENYAHIEKFLATKSGGWVIRKSALIASRQEVEVEVEELLAAARHVQQHGSLPAPCVFEQSLFAAWGHAAGNPLEVLVEKGVALPALTAYLHVARPGLLATLRVTEMVDAFERHDLYSFFDSLCEAKVDLPRGGNIKFEYTDSLTVLDINAADRTNFLEVNHDAARCIMQQIRWRNLGGIIVVDFLKMKRPDDRRTIEDMLADTALDDASPVEVFGFTRLGLCEITRARRGRSLRELLTA